jgi:hypothetical protein
MPLPPEGLAADEIDQAEAAASKNPENSGEDKNQEETAGKDEEQFPADDTINAEKEEIKKTETDINEGMKPDEK